ncbi:MAG: flavodoxin [Armatimonadetes bacterium]|nr:flavodoxin [Candidatus Hippobium faecium]
MKPDKLILLCLLIAFLLILVGCKEKTEIQEGEGLSETIVVYFSATGNTEKVAECIADELHCGIYQIMPAEEYTEEDLDWKNKESRVSKEHQNRNIMPEMGGLVPELGVYKTLIIGYPIWFGEAPNIMASYLKISQPLPKGLKVIPFCTSGSSPIGDSCKNLFKDYKNVKITEGKRFGKDWTEEECREWVKSLGLK